MSWMLHDYLISLCLQQTFLTAVRKDSYVRGIQWMYRNESGPGTLQNYNRYSMGETEGNNENLGRLPAKGSAFKW
jgi:hypothetical protein